MNLKKSRSMLSCTAYTYIFIPKYCSTRCIVKARDFYHKKKINIVRTDKNFSLKIAAEKSYPYIVKENYEMLRRSN